MWADRVALQQQQTAGAIAPPVPRPAARRFSLWVGTAIPAQYTSVDELCAVALALAPPGVWDEVELLVKAGEGGSWQSTWDRHPLAISGPDKLAWLVGVARVCGVRLTPYLAIRMRPDWLAGEQAMARACVQAAGRCVLNVEPGADYYNGPLDPGFIRDALAGIGVPARTLEVCMIPRIAQVNELGGVACLRVWTDPTLVGSASWEVYDAAAGGAGPDSLRPDIAIPRLDGWGVPPQPQYRIIVVQRSRLDTWAQTAWAAPGVQVWCL